MWHCIKPSNRCHTVNSWASLASKDTRTERERALSLSRKRDKGTERERQRALRRGVPRGALSLCPSIPLSIDRSIVFLLSLSRSRTVFHLLAWSLAFSLLHSSVPSLVFEPALTLSHTHTHTYFLLPDQIPSIALCIPCSQSSCLCFITQTQLRGIYEQTKVARCRKRRFRFPAIFPLSRVLCTKWITENDVTGAGPKVSAVEESRF